MIICAGNKWGISQGRNASHPHIPIGSGEAIFGGQVLGAKGACQNVIKTL